MSGHHFMWAEAVEPVAAATQIDQRTVEFVLRAATLYLVVRGLIDDDALDAPEDVKLLRERHRDLVPRTRRRDPSTIPLEVEFVCRTTAQPRTTVIVILATLATREVELGTLARECAAVYRRELAQ